VYAGGDQLVAIVRDVTDARRESKLVRDLAGRLIVRQETERQRIARELHDDISQRIGLLNIEIDQIASQIDSELWRARLQKLSALAGEIAGDVHQISYALHPSRLMSLGLIDALGSLCLETSQQRQMDVRFTHGEISPLVDVNVSLCLYRIAQEALHNVARHSGTRQAHVMLGGDGAHITLEVVDAGVGFNPTHLPDDRLGLASIQERVAYLKGQLVIDAVPGGGTRIRVDIPLGSGAAMSQPSSAPSIQSGDSALDFA
jgi:signal transduction histidine kinase